MSIKFNEEYIGLVQKYEKEIGANRGDVSGNTARLKEFTAEVNESLDEYVALAIKSSSKWKFDDSGHDDMPTIKTNLVQGQSIYSFVNDENDNAIINILKTYAKQTGQAFYELKPIDADFTGNATGITGELGTQGVPQYYDKTGNTIILSPVPEANVTDGLKISINREASYFAYTDTDKKAGFDGTHHKFLYLRPAYNYARRNNLANFSAIQTEYALTVQDIKDTYTNRDKDDQAVLTTEPVNSI